MTGRYLSLWLFVGVCLFYVVGVVGDNDQCSCSATQSNFGPPVTGVYQGQSPEYCSEIQNINNKNQELVVSFTAQYPLCFSIINGNYCAIACTEDQNQVVYLTTREPYVRVNVFCEDTFRGCGTNNQYEISWYWRTFASCCAPHNFPGCYDENIQDCVCDVYDFCCNSVWNQTCVDKIANLGCGTCSGTENCCVTHHDVGCYDREITKCVCAKDSDCCNVIWDDKCVSLVNECAPYFCPSLNSTSCFFPHLSPGCDNSQVSKCVCGIDPFCCQQYWDKSCFNYAINDCADKLNSTTNCLKVHSTPGCDNSKTQQCVCNKDPYCCTVSWKDTCVDEAKACRREN